MKHIVVCEDDESIIEVMQLILEEAGYKVTAKTYCNSMETVRTLKPDMMFVDLWIPEVGGAEMCKRLKADKELKSIPVILVSASNDLEQIAKDVDANGFIRKPFNVKEIIDTANSFLKK